MIGGYPDGCDQTLHDCAMGWGREIFDEQRNADLRPEREENARNEIINADERFGNYLSAFDGNPLLDVCTLIGKLVGGAPATESAMLLARIVRDYQDFRIDEEETK